jgi:2'-5' RNA ligase
MEKFPTAPISFVISVSLESDLSNRLIALNHSLTKVYGEGSYALNEWWAPHVTLFQGGTDTGGMDELSERLDTLLTEVIGMELSFPRLRCEESSLLLLGVELTPALIEFEHSIANICAELHMKRPLYRPRAIAKMVGLSDEAQSSVMRTGSYKTGKLYQPHVSIAQFREVAPQEILEQAQSLLELPTISKVVSTSLMDAGHNNEKGDIIREWN